MVAIIVVVYISIIQIFIKYSIYLEKYTLHKYIILTGYHVRQNPLYLEVDHQQVWFSMLILDQVTEFEIDRINRRNPVYCSWSKNSSPAPLFFIVLCLF